MPKDLGVRRQVPNDRVRVREVVAAPRRRRAIHHVGSHAPADPREGIHDDLCMPGPSTGQADFSMADDSPDRLASVHLHLGDGTYAAIHDHIQNVVRCRRARRLAPTKKIKIREINKWRGHGGGHDYRQEYLDEFIRRKGRGSNRELEACRCHVRLANQPLGSDAVPPIPPLAEPTSQSTLRDASAETHQDAQPLFRCTVCHASRLECEECCLARHQDLPCHLVEKWDGERFTRFALRSAGIRLQLGHEDGSICHVPVVGHSKFCIVNSTAIHEVSVDFCGCTRSQPHRIQLLRADLFPSTLERPRTAFTMEALEQFHALTLTGKLSAYDYYKHLTYRTDALGLKVPKSRYKAFLRVILQYRHLKVLMRAGRGCMDDGVRNIEPGELAMVCPACPRPDYNLPAGWEDAPPEDRYLYRMFRAGDANFRLKNLIRGDDVSDPGLHTGLMYFGEPEAYKEHVAKYATQKDISTCSGFKTLAHAESKDATGLRATGVVMSCCARHEMIPGLGMGDLQSGERFCNVDYVFFNSLRPFRLRELFISYDVACQWIKKFLARMRALPLLLQLPAGVVVDAGVPKLHCRAHKLACQLVYSLSLIFGMGRTDGEGVERLWAFLNGCASSTKEMTPGHRHDTLDDHVHYLNWCKLISFGLAMLKKRKVARFESERQTQLHKEFTSVIPGDDTVANWTKQVEEWESDRTKPSPYATVSKHETEVELRLRMSEKERVETEAGLPRLSDTSASACLAYAFDIENIQLGLRRYRKGNGTDPLTTHAASELHRRRVALRRRINHLIGMQAVYMPGAAIKRQQSSIVDVRSDARVDVEDEKLWLPSDFNDDDRGVACVEGLEEKEVTYRKTQMRDALEDIRDSERVIRAYYAYRRKRPSGQGSQTRAQAFIDRQAARSASGLEKYNFCRAAMIKLLGEKGDWTKEFLPLDKSHCEAMQGADFDADTLFPIGEGARVMSWIWRSAGAVSSDAPGLLESARGEWLKSRARVGRWTEELRLVLEEMRRVKVSLLMLELEWRTRRTRRTTGDAALLEGARAYAAHQADVFRTLQESFTELWAEEDVGDDFEDLGWEDELAGVAHTVPVLAETHSDDESDDEDDVS